MYWHASAQTHHSCFLWIDLCCRLDVHSYGHFEVVDRNLLVDMLAAAAALTLVFIAPSFDSDLLPPAATAPSCRLSLPSTFAAVTTLDGNSIVLLHLQAARVSLVLRERTMARQV